MLGVIGNNGSGKTTLLQAVAGVLEPTRGQVRTEGPAASLVELSAGFHRDLTGHENLIMGGVLLGLSRATVRARRDDIVAFAGLSEEMLSSPVRTYSAGMALRLGFSLVAHSDLSVLLVDEVLAVGDEVFQQGCVTRVKELQAGGAAVMLVSHDLATVVEHCDRVAVLEGGAVARLGRPAETVEWYRRRGTAGSDRLERVDGER